jgi:hypothetical protein
MKLRVCLQSNKTDAEQQHEDQQWDWSVITEEIVNLVSSVSIVSGYWLDYRAIDVLSPAEAKRFFL